MIQKILFAALFLPLILSGGESVLQLRCIPSPNLLKNADFSRINEKGKPDSWTFDNCSRSPLFKSRIEKHSEGNYLTLASDWQKFGYWLQKVAIKEGVSYLASVEVQSEAPTPAMWLRCLSENGSGKVEYVVRSYLYHSQERKTLLKDFIDEKLINTLDSGTWNRIGKEVRIPRKSSMRIFDVRIGICGGNAGIARFRNPVFRESKATLQITVSGKNWALLTIKGAKPSTVKLDPEKSKQTVSVILPNARRIYRVELSGKGRIVSKEVTNE